MPDSAGPGIGAFCNLYKHNSRAASINALKANDIHNYTHNNFRWDYPCRCVSLPLEKSCFVLQHCLYMTLHDRVSLRPKFFDRLTSCSTECPGCDQKKHRNSLIRDVIICNLEIVFYSIIITVTLPERHDVSNTQPLDCCSLTNSMAHLHTLSLKM